jgi:hypothetical protein
MSEIQLQKKNSNIFCYCVFTVKAGAIVVQCQIVEYSPETEENTDMGFKEMSIDAFAKFLKEGWIVC